MYTFIYLMFPHNIGDAHPASEQTSKQKWYIYITTSTTPMTTYVRTTTTKEKAKGQLPAEFLHQKQGKEKRKRIRDMATPVR